VQEVAEAINEKSTLVEARTLLGRSKVIIEAKSNTNEEIKVIGVGGSGGNAINHMIESKVKGVEFIVMNTDAQDLHHSLAKKKIFLAYTTPLIVYAQTPRTSTTILMKWM
jgi:cell division GTPase FtsZ